MKISTAEIINPKLGANEQRHQEQRLFPYYAGYSSLFTSRLLSSLDVSPATVVLDPWNGSGTTTTAAAGLQCSAIGCDLNPAMVLIAKADLLSPLEASALEPLAAEICRHASEIPPSAEDIVEPLEKWLIPSSARAFRAIERQINRTLVGAKGQVRLAELKCFDGVAPLAAIMYLILFRTARRLLHPFFASNPTWVKNPSSAASRLRPKQQHISEVFRQEAAALAAQLATRSAAGKGEAPTVSLFRANSAALPVEKASVDLVFTSPPYCTRIDYAVATSIELAALGMSPSDFDGLRRTLLGTSTVPAKAVNAAPQWGHTCNELLHRMHSHPSKASTSYYYKNHIQYFSGIYESIGEIARVLKPNGTCVAIVQDSYYKEIHNDLPKIFAEMSLNFGLKLQRKEDFCTSRSMVNVNSKSRQYLAQRNTIESVLCFSNI